WGVGRARAEEGRLLRALLSAFRGLCLLYLPFINSPATLSIFAVLYGLNFYATAPVTQLLSADRFGRRSVGQVFGWVFLSHQIGAACAACLFALWHWPFGDDHLPVLSSRATSL